MMFLSGTEIRRKISVKFLIALKTLQIVKQHSEPYEKACPKRYRAQELPKFCTEKTCKFQLKCHSYKTTEYTCTETYTVIVVT